MISIRRYYLNSRNIRINSWKFKNLAKNKDKKTLRSKILKDLRSCERKYELISIRINLHFVFNSLINQYGKLIWENLLLIAENYLFIIK